MNKKLLASIALATLITTIPSISYAEEGDLFSIGVGYFDIMDQDAQSVDFRLEYRPNSTVFAENLKPWAGLEFNTDASTWMGGGLLYDWQFQDNWYLTPSLGVGLYTKGNSDKDLDLPVQIRTQLELSYEFKDTSRVGFSFSHMSNAGLGDDNPGTEIFGIYWHLPLDSVF